MPRILDDTQRALLRADNVAARALVTFHMDDGDHRYCDDINDVQDPDGNIYVGASALASASDIKSGTGFSAEQVTLTIDGTRLHAAGFTDPAALFRMILELPLHNRRVDIAYGLSYIDSQQIQLVLPAYAGKINFVKVVAPQVGFESLPESQEQLPQQNLQITLDSLAIRYTWITGRTRSNADQQEIFPGDTFFQYVGDAVLNESTLYWGKKNPAIAASNNFSAAAAGAARTI